MAIIPGVLGREESRIFHEIGVIPLHRLVIERYEESKHIDYDLLGVALDDALEWFYYDLVEEPALLERLPSWHSVLQDQDRRPTTDIAVIRDWLEREHTYFDERGGEFYTSEEAASFPIASLSLVDKGIYVGQNPTILLREPVLLFKPNLRGATHLLRPEAMASYGIETDGDAVRLLGHWYTKDGLDLVKLFGKEFAVNYTNRLLEKDASRPAP